MWHEAQTRMEALSRLRAGDWRGAACADRPAWRHQHFFNDNYDRQAVELLPGMWHEAQTRTRMEALSRLRAGDWRGAACADLLAGSLLSADATLVSSSANLDWATKYRFATATATATDYLLWDSDDCKSGELMNCPTCSKPGESGIRCSHCGARYETRIDSIPDTIDAIIRGLAEQFALWEKQLEERACREPK